MKRYRRWLGLAAAAELAAVTGLGTWKAWPLLLIYWDVGRLLPVTFSLQVAAAAVNLALFAGLIALARAISRIPLVRQGRRPRPSGFVIAAILIGLAIYLYPHARTHLLPPSAPAAGASIALVGPA